MKRALDLKRAATIAAALSGNSANEQLLNAEQLEWLTQWKSRHRSTTSATMRGNEAAEYYAASLIDNAPDPDPLRPDIEKVLYPNTTRILETDTVEQASEKYYRGLQSD